MKYERIINYVTDRPWAILEEKLHAIADLLMLRAAGLTLTQQEIEARIGEAREPSTSPPIDSTIALIPVWGTLCHRMNMFGSFSGGTSTEMLASKIRKLVADPSVQSIVLDIDSEGGMVEGIPELWSTIYEARGKKKIVAVSNGMAASAAYYMASAADEIVVIPSGSVGSIGVLHIHVEASKANEERGFTYTITRAGKYKGEGNPFEPLTDDAKDYVQERVDEAYGWFVRDVAKGRGVSVADVRKGFGEGRLVTAKKAKELGMVDRIATLEETLARLVGRSSRTKAMRASDSVELSSVTYPQPTFTWTEPGGTITAGITPRNRTEKKAPEDTPWEAPTLKDYTDKPWGDLSDNEKRLVSSDFVWAPKVPPDRFTDLKGPHHRPSDGAVVWNGVRNLTARFNQLDIPAADKPAVKAHLRAEYKKFDKPVPDILKGEETVEEDFIAKSEEEAPESTAGNSLDILRLKWKWRKKAQLI